MKQWKICLSFFLKSLFLISFFASAIEAAGSPAGKWTTTDDVSGKKRAIVNLVVSGSTLSGTIVETFPEPGDKGTCEKCPGGFKDKPVKGLQFIWGLKDQGNGVWSGGKILDPKTGSIYKATMTLKGNQLDVRGYVGISALGRTQTWSR